MPEEQAYLLLDRSTISPFLRLTIVDYQLPVIAMAGAASLALPPGTRFVAEESAVRTRFIIRPVAGFFTGGVYLGKHGRRVTVTHFMEDRLLSQFARP